MGQIARGALPRPRAVQPIARTATTVMPNTYRNGEPRGSQRRCAGASAWGKERGRRVGYLAQSHTDSILVPGAGWLTEMAEELAIVLPTDANYTAGYTEKGAPYHDKSVQIAR